MYNRRAKSHPKIAFRAKYVELCCSSPHDCDLQRKKVMVNQVERCRTLSKFFENLVSQRDFLDGQACL